MAGAGYKLFQTGDVLTAAQVNTYLNEQTVMVFVNSTARTSALSGVLAEGMVSYLQDTNAVEVYDGSNWVSIGASGDITGVTAGTGISGGGTSGTVTITNDMATTITAAGDIVVGTGSGTYDNLPIGTTGQVLTADTTVSPYKVKWATVGGGGKVLQVVQGTYSTSTATTSTSYVDSGLTASITPSATSSKILVLATLPMKINGAAGDDLQGSMQLVRASTSILNYENNFSIYLGAAQWKFPQTFTYLDSPSTTSSTAYKVQIKSQGKTITAQEGNSTSAIILLEIGA